ncbi:hypothetical protein [Actinoplanes rectilineatus]|uniref:hypothetical protein n=1 Tax=Actinoplanes rectilineatus TaxID=113571 RepID=UPI0012F7BB7A|nr:hypothetical protein [Actinoplanes rectilineatus]
MMRHLPRLAAALLLLVAGCSEAHPAASPSAAASAPACRTELPETTSGLLQVRQVWPDSPDDVHDYSAAAYDAAACTATPSPVDCAHPFPWIAGTVTQTDAVLGAMGVAYVHEATLTRGSSTVREVVLTLRGTAETEDHPLMQVGLRCGAMTHDLPVLAFQLPVGSDDIGGTGILAASSDKILWLAFTEGDWTEAEELRVTKLALSVL